MKLVLPVPPSPNRWKKHPIAQQVQKDRYRGEVWIAALKQAKPTRDPPKDVTVNATLYLCRMRDEDNAAGSMKWALDALRSEQTGLVRWRRGIADLCGYFVDDDPNSLHLNVEQVRVRTKAEERLEVEVVT